ncbi:MAG: 3-hydroxyacyl-CoA dehydrogenase NAD-binding domain-containing protein [Alphaproteobacteria bacterium]
MPQPIFDTVAVVGSGVIGRSWLRVFTRAGCRTRLYDRDPEQAKRALAWFEEDTALDAREGFASAEDAKRWRSLITHHTSLSDAVAGAGFVQESGPEKIETKRAIYRELDEAAAPATILSTSTSALDINAIAGDLPGAQRCIMAHPCNPPHIIPVVEILANKKTAPEVTKKTIEFLTQVGQKPVVLNWYVNGFLLNRIQAAVVREAFLLVESGVADAEAVDACIKDGLALRWAFIGNFGANHLNADGGIRAYFARYADAYRSMIGDLENRAPNFDDATMAKIVRERGFGETPQQVRAFAQWRDRMIVRLKALKAKHPQT